MPDGFSSGINKKEKNRRSCLLGKSGGCDILANAEPKMGIPPVFREAVRRMFSAIWQMLLFVPLL